MLRKFFIVIGAVLIVLVCFVMALSISKPKDISDIKITQQEKRIVLITIDSLMSEPLQKAMAEGKAPAFSFLVENGQLYTDMVSSYPTMSVTLDSSLLTGVFADEHKIPGLIWFNQDANRIVSYGSGPGEIWNDGVRNVVQDSVIRLNNKHLSSSVTTIHEELANRNIQSASINGLIYRGKVEQNLNVPFLISTMKILPKNIEVKGPTILSLGALSQLSPNNNLQKFAWDKMGVSNEFSVREFKYLLEQNQLPSFTLAYLPDADARIHSKGSDDLQAIEKADESLQDLLNSFSSWEEAIKSVTWIVLGDSGQSAVKKDKSLIDLNKVLSKYSFWERNNQDGQIAFAVNERMAYIYLKDDKLNIQEVVEILKKDDRIAFISWSENEQNYVTAPNNEELVFSKQGNLKDEYNQTWDIEGDESILDLTVQNGEIQFNNYPDALARLNGALHSHKGRYIIVDAVPNYEFIEKHSYDHAGGGAHGSLHKVDSLVPLIITGTDSKPSSLRLVDIKDWVLQMLE
ncbi:predicted AlkP superfamily pyrophosphatase or phosphodiesterase [Ureibacillus xyleni]|uniref:Predicted AlkP superfamily pyrophosphatase or phosphodiesterase n=1 Tax=Ureibacillus xyleni TaxID=614648 RepID=A0A285SSL2_9BACL|nr:alkaline phosphatase family protein [Ureibacillus xyleni]SOC11400.1 predicted AlkP superfamily pyrophosphatase or phosphodiesterase [Ureibacillus xyleni]